MNITFCPLQYANAAVSISCPTCHTTRYRRHGAYSRKGFHTLNDVVAIPMTVQRYRCLNTECPRCTFSILPPHVMRYSRFFWPCLLALRQALAIGLTPYHQAKHVWQVGRGVIVRAAALLNQLAPWVEELHQELTDGGQVRKLRFMVKIIIRKLGRIELVDRWYRHRYPLRFR